MNAESPKGLRFAPLIRVSTENQAERGRSLKDQREAIVGYVKVLDGTIPDHCWAYVGQESATPQGEKRMFDRLLGDAKRREFDAVIVYIRADGAATTRGAKRVSRS